jgi:hypothetical protein
MTLILFLCTSIGKTIRYDLKCRQASGQSKQVVASYKQCSLSSPLARVACKFLSESAVKHDASVGSSYPYFSGLHPAIVIAMACKYAKTSSILDP